MRSGRNRPRVGAACARRSARRDVARRPCREAARGRALLAGAGLLACLAAGCGAGPQARSPRPADTGAHSAAMAPGSQLDPPHLADLPRDVAAVGEVSGVPVLCYHYFRPRFAPEYALRVVGAVVLGLPTLGPREFWTTPAAEFERHLRALREAGVAVVTLDDVADCAAAGRPLPRRAVVLTIDDADRSVYRTAFPLLERYGVTAHLFVPTGRIGRRWSGLDVCTAAQLREMAASGHVRLESHTHDLHLKVETGAGDVPIFLDPQQLAARSPAGSAPVRTDLLASRAALAKLAGRRQVWLAWPYGFANARLDSLARAWGYRGTVSLKPRPFDGDTGAASVGRYAVTAHTTTAAVLELCGAAAPASGTGR